MNRPMLKTLSVAYVLMFAQQFSGINAIIFYGVTILEATGVGMESLVELVIFAVVQLVACVASAMLIDKVTFEINYRDIGFVSPTEFSRSINLSIGWH